MSYKNLRVFSYTTENDNKLNEEFEKRYNSYTTIHTDLKIYPFINEFRKTSEKYELFYLPLPELLLLEERIKYNSEELIKLKDELPGIVKDKITISTLIEEIQSTNETEGIRSSRHEIGEAVNNRNENGKAKKRFQGIVNMYMNINEKTFEFVDAPEKIRNIYDALFEGEIQKKDWPDGEIFRKDPVDIKGDTKIIHTGNPTEESIIKDMWKLVKFMNNKDIPFLSKCFISHYFLEYIHPFYDGNGRLGRFVISSYLSRKLDPFTGLSVSNAVNDNKKKYYDAFTDVSHPKNFGEITFFIKTMLELVIDGQNKMIEQLKEAKLKMNFVKTYMNNITNVSDEAKGVLYGLIQFNLFDVYSTQLTDNQFTKVFKMTRYLLDKLLAELVDNDYLVKCKFKPSVHKLSDTVLEAIE